MILGKNLKANVYQITKIEIKFRLMKAIIDVFKMDEISPKKRASVLIKLGNAINYEYSANVTEPLIFELVSILDPSNPILKDDKFLKRAKQ